MKRTVCYVGAALVVFTLVAVVSMERDRHRSGRGGIVRQHAGERQRDPQMHDHGAAARLWQLRPRPGQLHGAARRPDHPHGRVHQGHRREHGHGQRHQRAGYGAPHDERRSELPRLRGLQGLVALRGVGRHRQRAASTAASPRHATRASSSSTVGWPAARTRPKAPSRIPCSSPCSSRVRLTHETTHSSRVLGLAALLTALSGVAQAQTSFSVDPLLIPLNGQATSAVLTITNPTAKEIRFEIKAFAWDQTPPDGVMSLTPTQEVVIFPPLVSVKAEDDPARARGHDGDVGRDGEELPDPGRGASDGRRGAGREPGGRSHPHRHPGVHRADASRAEWRHRRRSRSRTGQWRSP